MAMISVPVIITLSFCIAIIILYTLCLTVLPILLKPKPPSSTPPGYVKNPGQSCTHASCQGVQETTGEVEVPGTCIIPTGPGIRCEDPDECGEGKFATNEEGDEKNSLQTICNKSQKICESCSNGADDPTYGFWQPNTD